MKRIFSLMLAASLVTTGISSSLAQGARGAGGGDAGGSGSGGGTSGMAAGGGGSSNGGPTSAAPEAGSKETARPDLQPSKAHEARQLQKSKAATPKKPDRKPTSDSR